jgi:cytochrome b561
MPPMTTGAPYTRTAIALHWLAGALILGNLAFGLYMTDLPLSPAKLRYYSWHKWVGVTIFLVSAARLLWRLTHRPPSPPEAMPRWQRRAASVSHALLYVLFFAAPITGWLFSSAAGFPTVYLGLVQLPDLVDKSRELADILQVIHRGLTWSLGTLALVHAAAAFKHHLIDRDDVLVRMLPFLKPRN